MDGCLSLFHSKYYGTDCYVNCHVDSLRLNKTHRILISKFLIDMKWAIETASRSYFIVILIIPSKGKVFYYNDKIFLLIIISINLTLLINIRSQSPTGKQNTCETG